MNQKHTAWPVQPDSQTNDTYCMNWFFLVNQNHTAQPVKSEPKQMSLMNQFFNEYFENTPMNWFFLLKQNKTKQHDQSSPIHDPGFF